MQLLGNIFMCARNDYSLNLVTCECATLEDHIHDCLLYNRIAAET